MKIPKDNLVKVNPDGSLEFTDEQWAFFKKASGTKAKTFAGEKKAIRKLITKAIKAWLEAAKRERGED